jgi:uncharacterized oxidoreductase
MQPTQLKVLITGGASGIGFAMAKRFHAQGNQVILVGRSEAALAQAASALPGALTSVADVAITQDRERLVLEFADIHVLVNNAGMQISTPIAQNTPELIAHELQVNFLAPVLLSRAYLPLLIKQPCAAIINVSSGLALVPKEASSMYCASKAALHSFSKTLRWQLESTSVRVFEVLPPLVDTAMTTGRGKGKISADQLVQEFWTGFINDRYEMRIGKTKLLSWINRLSPVLAEKIMRKGL